MLAGFGLHIGQIKLFACFYLFIFSGIVEQLFSHIYSCTNAHANQTKRICPRFSIVIINMGQHMRFSYLSHKREAKAQLILHSTEPCAVHTITKEERKLSSLVLYIYVSILTKCPVRSLQSRGKPRLILIVA